MSRMACTPTDITVVLADVAKGLTLLISFKSISERVSFITVPVEKVTEPVLVRA